MPIYEYLCNACKRRTILYHRSFSTETRPLCSSCGSADLMRLFSTFSVRKTDRDIYDNILSDSQLVDGMARSDPRALAEWNKRMTRGTEEGTAPEYDEMLEKMERGTMPAELMGEGAQASETQETEEE